MAANIDKIAKRLGADLVQRVPEAGGGAFGAARMANIVARLQSRLAPGQGKRPGRPTVASWAVSPKIPMSEATEEKLTRLAAQASASGHRISPMQLAAQLLEEAVARLPEA